MDHAESEQRRVREGDERGDVLRQIRPHECLHPWPVHDFAGTIRGNVDRAVRPLNISAAVVDE